MTKESVATEDRFAGYLAAFDQCEPLRQRVLLVLQAIPAEVQDDFLSDPLFRMTLEDYTPGKGTSLYMPMPSPESDCSRCVVLRRRLATFSEAFATYVIAHELAHAYLRNGGWGEITDREQAADALAASWGFPRVNRI